MNMTDKEKAKEYVDKIKRQYLLSEEGLGCAEQGYLDGLKEGKKDATEWHDLRENPSDLPEVKGYYWVALKNQRKCVVSYFNHSEMEFNDLAIAWCELPLYVGK